MILVVFLLTVLTGAAMLVLTAGRTAVVQASETRSKTTSDLIADAGLRAAILELLGPNAPTIFPHSVGDVSFAGGSYRYTVTEDGNDRTVYVTGRVDTGRAGADTISTSSELEVRLSFVPPTGSLPGAVTLQSRGGEFELEDGGNLAIHFNGVQGRVSGTDHSAIGVPLPGDTNPPTAGAAMTPLRNEDAPGFANWTITAAGGGATTQLGGTPASTNTSAGVDPALLAKLLAARNTPDVTLGEGTHGGVYGSPLDPMVIRVNLGEEGSASFNGTFNAVGLMIVNVGEWEAEGAQSLLTFNGGAQFKGIIIIRASEVETEGASTLIKMNGGGPGGTQITGGVIVVASDEWEVEGSALRIVSVNGQAKLLYSSESVGYALNAAGSIAGYNIASYRVVR